VLNAFIILFYFIGGGHPGFPRYLTDQLTPFGLINMSAAFRQLIFLGAYFVCFNPKLQKRLKHMAAALSAPLWELGFLLEKFTSGLLEPLTKA
ncbi:MAG: hypothetical protein WB643_13250, partial [Candidatus Bathyarchaeia archaeon]